MYEEIGKSGRGKRDSVAIVKYKESLKQTLAQGLALIGGFGEIQSPVLIKPNICTMKDETGHSVTNLNVIRAVMDLIMEADNRCSIKIIESDSQSKNADDAFIKFGYKELCDEMRSAGFDVTTVNLSNEPREQITFDGLYFKDPQLPRIITQPHYFISVAVAKTHYLAYITGAMKNLFGVLPRKDMSFYHSKIHDVVTDLVHIIKPNLNIVDARVGVEDWNGPKTHRIGAFIIGKQPVSVDSVMTRMMSLDPKNVGHLMSAKKYDLGYLNPPIIGENIDSVRVKFSNPP